MKMRESDVQNKIRIYLSQQGFTVFRTNVIGTYTKDGRYVPPSLPAGFSDLFAVKDGKAYFFEVKTKGGRATNKQINFLEQMKKKGCVAEVVYSVKDVKEVLDIDRS
jgi:hypothetical protein